MRNYPRAGAIAVSALAIAAGTLAFAPAARSPRRVPATSATSFAEMRPGNPMTFANGRSSAALTFRPSSRVQSTNWAGYVAVHAASPFRYVQSTLFVPYTDCASTPNAISSHWVGFDGVSNNTVEQLGIMAACQGTNAVYTAWYEMYPEYPVYLSMVVRPGNSVIASMYYSKRTKKFQLRLDDTTNGHRFSRDVPCPSGSSCARASADVISEAPAAGSVILPLANFRAESYSGTRVTDQTGQRSGMRDHWWDTLSVTMVDKTGTHILDQPTAIYHGTAFDNYWQGVN